MDATALRWILAVIGVVVILGVYLFSVYQSRVRRNAAIRTFTQDELESGVIEDESLRDELSHISSMLDEEVKHEDIEKIKITPEQETRVEVSAPKQPNPVLPSDLLQIAKENRVAHVLKPDDAHLLTGEEVKNALQHAQLDLQDDGLVRSEIEAIGDFVLANLSQDGSLSELDNPQFTTAGLVCYFDYTQCQQALGCYELMLKKIDELVRVLDLKVYDEDLQLLTLQHVTDTRSRISSK
jgi:FtsZ-interacting cell division protein ZipA